MGSWQARWLAAERDRLLTRIAAKPDVTLRELVAELGARGADDLRLGVGLLNDEGIGFKKACTRARSA